MIQISLKVSAEGKSSGTFDM